MHKHSQSLVVRRASPLSASRTLSSRVSTPDTHHWCCVQTLFKRQRWHTGDVNSFKSLYSSKGLGLLGEDSNVRCLA